MSTDRNPRASAPSLESRLEFETLISGLSSRLINLAPAEVDREIDRALRGVCEFLAIDLAVLWQWSGAGPSVIRPTQIYSVEAGLAPFEPLHQEQFPWYVGKMLAGQLVTVSSLDDFPEEAAVDRENCRLIGVKSNLTIPLLAGGEPPIGALGLNTLRAERDWPDVLVRRLQLIAEIFTNALIRKRQMENLKESEERLSLAADAAGAGLWMLDYGTGVFWITERARMIFGFAKDAVLDMERLRASVHPDDWDRVESTIEQARSSDDLLQVEYRIRHADGYERWISSLGRARPMSAGEPRRLMGSSIDITKRKLDDEGFRASQARLAAGAELAGLGYYEVDLGRGVVHLDARFREICGIPPGDEPGLAALEFWIEGLHPDDRPRVLELRRQLHIGDLAELAVEYRFQHPVQGEKWIQHAARVAERNGSGAMVRSYGVIRDITTQRRTEEDMLDLSRRLIRAHEEERALLARELHDDMTQRLAVMAIDLGRVESTALDGAWASVVQSVREGLVRLSEDVHSLAYQLHPSVLEELGLAEALRTECERIGRRGHFEIAAEINPLHAVIGKDAALCLFRVAQEALNNVTRHAGARAASVTLRDQADGLLLVVRDDGIGFDPAAHGRARSLGLSGMRERVRLVNGTLDVKSAPGGGTTIAAWVPAQGWSP